MVRGIFARRGKEFDSHDIMDFSKGKGEERFATSRNIYNEGRIPKARGRAVDKFNYP